MLIGDLLTGGLRATPHATAATLGTARLTFTELDAATRRSVIALRRAGLGHGDYLAWWADPGLDVLAAFLACARIGAVFAPMNPRLTSGEAAIVFEHLRPRLVVADPAHAAQVGDLPSAHLMGIEAACPPIGADPGPTEPDATARRPVDTEVHIAYLTSGSTGVPKAVLVSHRASWLRSAPGGATFTTAIRGRGGVTTTFPLFHYGGWHYVMEAWLNATAVHLVHRADAAEVVEAVTRNRASALYCIPAVWERILGEEFAGADLSSLNHCDTGTSPVTGDLVARIKARVPGSSTSVLYGSTEAGRMAALRDWELADHPGAVGRGAAPLALWTDESGEVCVSGPTLMEGYLRAPEATAAVLENGVYRSGDLGRVDEQGYLTLVGRTREVIRTGGEFVAPVEVERACLTHPAVLDAAAVGLPDPTWHEVLAVAVVTAPGRGLDLAELRAHVAPLLAPHKHPRRLVTVESIPRTAATGQVQRSHIRALILAADEKENRR